MKKNNTLTVKELKKINSIAAYQQSKLNQYLKSAIKISLDAEKMQRLEAQLCPACWYLSHDIISGQAFTDWTCKLCGTKETYSNTNTPQLCKVCAQRFGLCISCGGTLDNKQIENKN